jgi:benzaldehyde dehydrogenase (NAD)
MVHVNDATPQDEASAPFGGIGQSGLGGRSGGDANLEKFTERRWLTLNPGPVHLPLLGSSPTKVRRLRDCRPSG